MSQLFDRLSLIPQDDPQTGDCFYLTIQLYIAQHYSPTILTSVIFLRTVIHNIKSVIKLTMSSTTSVINLAFRDAAHADHCLSACFLLPGFLEAVRAAANSWS